LSCPLRLIFPIPPFSLMTWVFPRVSAVCPPRNRPQSFCRDSPRVREVLASPVCANNCCPTYVPLPRSVELSLLRSVPPVSSQRVRCSGSSRPRFSIVLLLTLFSTSARSATFPSSPSLLLALTPPHAFLFPPGFLCLSCVFSSTRKIHEI